MTETTIDIAESTQVVNESVDESIVDFQQITTLIVSLDLTDPIEVIETGMAVTVIEPATEIQIEDSLTTILDLYGGPQGPPGPTNVSTDAYNVAYLGTDGLLYVPEKARMPLDLEVDESDSATLGFVYVGEAAPGTPPAGAQWRIKRIHDTGAATSIDWAEGNADSVHIWDNRKTLTYGP